MGPAKQKLEAGGVEDASGGLNNESESAELGSQGLRLLLLLLALAPWRLLMNWMAAFSRVLSGLGMSSVVDLTLSMYKALASVQEKVGADGQRKGGGG